LTAKAARTDSSPSRRALAIACAQAADAKLGGDVVVLSVSGLTPIADYFIIATGESHPHMRALADAVEETVVAAGERPHHREGDQESPWILLDCHDIIVHIFSGIARRFYDLERLWNDAPRVEWGLKTVPAAATRPDAKPSAVRAGKTGPGKAAKGGERSSPSATLGCAGGERSSPSATLGCAGGERSSRAIRSGSLGATGAILDRHGRHGCARGGRPKRAAVRRRAAR